MAESEGFDTSTAGAVSRAAPAAGNPLKKSRALRIFRQSALGVKKKSKLQILLANLLFALCRDFWFKIKMAESEGFEPSVPCGTPHFQCGAFDHSTSSPSITDYFII